MIFFRLFTHLLPRARAWRLTVEKKLRRFIVGFAEGFGPDAREFVDLILLDVFPETTRQLSEWESQFGLTAGTLTESERRERLAGAWTATGGQSPRYIEDVLRAAGFDVYVHEWFAPGSLYPPTPRDPNLYLTSDISSGMECGEAIAEAGEEFAMCGYVVYTPGDVISNELDNPAQPPTVIPTDPAYYPFFFYIGAAVFPNLANVPTSRRAELEALILRIKPTHCWVGMLINYT